MTELPRITSRVNEKLKHARRVRDGRERDEIFIEGRRLVQEAIRSNIGLKAAFISHSFLTKPQNFDLVGSVNARCRETFSTDDKIFETITDTENAQGIVVLASRPEYGLGTMQLQDHRTPVSIYLYRINNPSNLGAIIRTAEAAGAHGIMISENSADAFSPKSLRASMGSAFRMPITADVKFEEAVERAGVSGSAVTAADVSGKVNYTDINWRTPRLLVFGSEAHGLKPEQIAKVEEVIKIPMQNGVESLNLAVSCGIILFEAIRQCKAEGEPI